MTSLRNLTWLTSHRAQLATLNAFFVSYPDLPDATSINCAGEWDKDKTPSIHFDCSLVASKTLFMDTIAKLFGKSGWTKKYNPSYNCYDWYKTIDGVSLRLSEVEDLPRPLSDIPVDPKEWPLLLGDVEVLPKNDDSSYTPQEEEPIDWPPKGPRIVDNEGF